ncbi:hypothetical protein Tcan_11591 [Toxocara canis]|uniref:G-protein coupled receptors family 1 profile domain-containing protein n=1 Tax=Toxocara canis TaxID=6265 RepID=A0A0B2VZY9_TOXCA|nr:hypothetical protein Tcan_11591 [Toxocara canis]
MSTESTTTPASMFDVGGTCSYSTDGAFCGPYFEDFENWFVLSTLPFLFVSTLFILYLAFFLLPLRDIINLYTINIYVPMLSLAIAQLIFHIDYYFAYYGVGSKLCLIIVSRVVLFLNALNAVNFRITSITLLISIFCAYRFPLTYKRFFSLRHWIKYLLILNTLSVTFSIMYTVMEQFWDPTGTLSIAVVLPIFIAAFLFTVLLTILALISILRNLRRRTHHQSSPPSREQRQLLTTVIYITPPNLTNLPGLFISILYILEVFSTDVRPLKAMMTDVFTLQNIAVQLKPIIVTLSTLIALPIYRKALLDLLKRRKSSNNSNISTVGLGGDKSKLRAIRSVVVAPLP